MTVSTTTSKVSFAGNGSTTAFAVGFYFLQTSHLKVVLRSADGSEAVKTLGSDYTVTGAGITSGGTVTMGTAPASGQTLVVLRNVPLTQLVDYQPNDPFPANTHEQALDQLTMENQQQQIDLDRSVKFPVSDSSSLSTELPASSARANKLMKFNSDGSIGVTTENYDANLATVAGISTQIVTVAGISSNVTSVAGNATNINTVAANNTNVTAVGGNISNVNTVASNATAINAVNSNATNINTVAGKTSDITTVAGVASSVSTVAGISSNVTTVAGKTTEITTVAGQITPTNNIGTVAGKATDISTVAGISSAVSTVAGNSSNVSTVAGISSAVSTVATNATAVSTVSTNISSVNSAATNISAIIAAPTQATNAANSATAAAASAAAAAASAASGLYSAVQDKSANYSVVSGDAGDLLRVSTGSGAVTITLPLISSVSDGFKIAIVKWTGDANAVNVARSGSDTINGATSSTIGAQYTQITFVADFETNQWFAATSGLGSTNVAVDVFSGNGSTTAFTLSGDPGTKNNTWVHISGVYQNKSTYSLSGTTITFSPAPPSGTSNIEVVWTQPLPVGTPSDGTVTRAKLSVTGAPDGTKFLRDDMTWQAAGFPSGTAMLFAQTSAPTGWTKSTTHNDKALRVVSGTASSGGSVAFTTAFASGLSAGATTLSTAQIPSHKHNLNGNNADTGASSSTWATLQASTNTVSSANPVQNTGGGGSHDHTLPSFAVQYVDVIIATQN